MASETIDHSTLHKLVESGVVDAAQVMGTQGGWSLTVKYGRTERPLAAQRSRQVRLFKRLETVVNYLKEMGISRFEVDASNYNPYSQQQTTRPDRAEALKRAHEAAAYDAWYREQVQVAIDDPRPAVSHDEAKRQFAARKKALLKGD